MPAPTIGTARARGRRARGFIRRTNERCVHLPESVPGGERTVILPPVVIVDAGDVDVGAVRETGTVRSGAASPSSVVRPGRVGAPAGRGLARTPRRPGSRPRTPICAVGGPGPASRRRCAALQCRSGFRPALARPARNPRGRQGRPPPPCHHEPSKGIGRQRHPDAGTLPAELAATSSSRPWPGRPKTMTRIAERVADLEVAAARHRDELLAADGERHGGRVAARAGVELPQQLAGLGVVGVEVAVAFAGEGEAAGGGQRRRPSSAAAPCSARRSCRS